MSDNYKLIESAIDKLGKSTSLIQKVKFKHGEYDRERDFMNHTINSLRLEITKFAEFEQELTGENAEEILERTEAVLKSAGQTTQPARLLAP